MFGIYNAENALRFELQKSYKIFDDWNKEFPKIDALYIDWIAKANNKGYALQATIVDRYIKKKIPIVIFDRYLYMKKEEIEWLRKFNNVFLFEPALHNRFGFRYLPQSVKILKYEDLESKKYEWDLGYKGHLINKSYSFEKYFKKFAESNLDKKVCYSSAAITMRSEEYRYANLKKLDDVNWNDIKCTVAIDTHKHYAMGYLDNWVFKAMEKGCMVLLPVEHKYFGNMFNKLVVNNIKDIEILSMNLKGSINQIIIEEIYNNIENLYPEFTMDYTIEIIKECVK